VTTASGESRAPGQVFPRLDKTRLHIFSDFDGTITDTDTLVFLTTHLGGGPEMIRQIGQQLRSHELTLREGIAAEMASIRAPFPEAEQLLRARVRLDAHFVPFASWCQSQQLPLTVLSAGFHQTIELFLPSADFPHLTILANELEPDTQRGWQCHFRDTTADGHDKAQALLAARARGHYTIFIGDGLSDRQAAGAADEVFAKHSLAEYCRTRNLAFHSYQTFEEVWEQLRARI
jgi:2,3-diketo-5-methylthio-1-phosphopentane phosphatase